MLTWTCYEIVTSYDAGEGKVWGAHVSKIPPSPRFTPDSQIFKRDLPACWWLVRTRLSAVFCPADAARPAAPPPPHNGFLTQITCHGREAGCAQRLREPRPQRIATHGLPPWTRPEPTHPRPACAGRITIACIPKSALRHTRIDRRYNLLYARIVNNVMRLRGTIDSWWTAGQQYYIHAVSALRWQSAAPACSDEHQAPGVTLGPKPGNTL